MRRSAALARTALAATLLAPAVATAPLPAQQQQRQQQRQQQQRQQQQRQQNAPVREPALVTAARALPVVVRYVLRVDSADLGAMHVEMRLRNLPDTFRLAMAAHPEYDDRFWRYVDGPRVDRRGGAVGEVVRLDSALWRVVAPGSGSGEVTVRYAVRLPPAAAGAVRGSWRPFLAPTGGLPAEDSTRVAHLAGLIGRYFANPGNSRIAPERASLAAYGSPPGALGDYDPSTHLQGELLSAMLDLVVRDATAGRRSLDDVMRALLARHANRGAAGGFTGRDVERAVAEQCACDVGPFFDAHVRGARPIDFDRYLRLAGLRAVVSRAAAHDRDGRPRPDLRVWGWVPEGEHSLRLVLNDPSSAWGRAGLHTGDRIVTMNDSAVADWPALRRFIVGRHVGDTVRVAVERGGRPVRTSVVVVTALDEPVVRIEEVAGATARQRATRAGWMAGRR